ncbi:hypothetical protein BGZ63DRAFT_321267, partial [Mariannaea sp. PMI_226]
SITPTFLGGCLLLFIAINAWDPVDCAPDFPTFMCTEAPPQQRAFWFGSTLDIDDWLAIVGISLGILSYGLVETYMSVVELRYSVEPLKEPFELTQRSTSLRRKQGLAPVRYLLPIIIATVPLGYKFGIVNTQMQVIEKLPEDQMFSLPISMQWLDSDGTVAPWISDTVLGDANQGFVHELVDMFEYNQPPQNVTMVNRIECPALFEDDENGYLVTREMVMVANMTKEPGNFTMTRDHSGWLRSQASSHEWFQTSDAFSCDGKQRTEALVEYRIPGPGTVQIQWARFGDELLDNQLNSNGLPVESRVTYHMYYAVAEVTRIVEMGRYDSLLSVEILSQDTDSISNSGINDAPHVWSWVDAIISDKESSMLDGVSAVVRAALVVWEQGARHQANGHYLGLLPIVERPFGPESPHLEMLVGLLELPYPFYNGIRTKIFTGLTVMASYVFGSIGILASFAALASLW